MDETPEQREFRRQNLRMAIVSQAIRLARARSEHAKYASDPTKNVATATALREQEVSFDRVMEALQSSAPDLLDEILHNENVDLQRRAGLPALMNLDPATLPKRV